MDPQTCWNDLLDSLAERDWERVEELAEGLLMWLDRGGFPPRAITGRDLGADWDHEIALTACRFALARARKGACHVS
jgi:hypothetical protein